MSAKSLLKFKSNRALGQNIWPTRKITPKQKLILLKISTRPRAESSYSSNNYLNENNGQCFRVKYLVFIARRKQVFARFE